jgi:hypothetical protein
MVYQNTYQGVPIPDSTAGGNIFPIPEYEYYSTSTVKAIHFALSTCTQYIHYMVLYLYRRPATHYLYRVHVTCDT